jgi:hypothetical protein
MLTRVTKLPLYSDQTFKMIQNRAVDIVNRCNGFDDPQWQAETLQGFRWKDDSCTLDAMLMIFLRLAEILHGTKYWPQKGESVVLHQLLEDAAVLLKMPWHSRTADDMDQFRNRVREGLSKKLRIKISRTSILERFHSHIIPQSWITFPLELKIKCSECGNEYTVDQEAKGLSLSLRNGPLDGLSPIAVPISGPSETGTFVEPSPQCTATLTNVQGILQSIVFYLCCKN